MTGRQLSTSPCPLPGMVLEVSAMLVASTTLRAPGSAAGSAQSAPLNATLPPAPSHTGWRGLKHALLLVQGQRAVAAQHPHAVHNARRREHAGGTRCLPIPCQRLQWLGCSGRRGAVRAQTG
jgi:hypothetical protein